MKESHMRQLVVKLLKPLHAFSVENGGCHPGTPDVNYAGGWIELKATERWPVNRKTIVKLDHDLTPQQRIWLVKRWQAGGRAFVLLTIEGDWLLFRGEVAAKVIGSTNGAKLIEASLMTWPSIPNYMQLGHYLTDAY